MKLFRNNPGEMPFLDHLEELRWRLIWSLGTVILFAGLGFLVVMRFDVLGILEEPIKPFLHGQKLVFLDPMVPFFITLKIGIILGLIAGAPVVIYHLWSFLAPALTKSEKRAIMPSLYLGVVLFAAGVATTVLVESGHAFDAHDAGKAGFVAADLLAAARHITGTI